MLFIETTPPGLHYRIKNAASNSKFSYHIIIRKKTHNDSVGFAAGRVSGVEAGAAWCVRVSGRAGPTSNTIAVASKGEAVGPTSDWYLHVDVLNKRI